MEMLRLIKTNKCLTMPSKCNLCNKRHLLLFRGQIERDKKLWILLMSQMSKMTFRTNSICFSWTSKTSQDSSFVGTERIFLRAELVIWFFLLVIDFGYCRIATYGHWERRWNYCVCNLRLKMSSNTDALLSYIDGYWTPQRVNDALESQDVRF